jgi:glutaredoxin
MNTRAALITAIALSIASLAGGCTSKKSDDGTTPITSKGFLPALSIRDDTPNMMLTYIDEKGDTHVALATAEIPASSRSIVRVVISDREDGTRDLFYVTDLSQKGVDGSYSTRTMGRREWESEIERRREAYLAKVAPAPQPRPSGAPPGPSTNKTGVTAIIYGAAWCGPCHQAADYLKSKGVQVVMKDVEESPAAAAEMREKLTRTGQRGGTIPIIDVQGQVLVGFSPGSLDRALAKAAGTML